MPLPRFGQNDLLPDGVHFANETDLYDRCVREFAASTTRAKIYGNLIQYQKAIVSVGLHATQWVNGSFVDRARIDPEDVDLVNFLDASELNELSRNFQNQATQLLNGLTATKKAFDTHSFLVVKFPSGHPLEAQFERARQYWRRWFATAQAYSGERKDPSPSRGRKGIVQMYAGEGRLCPEVSHS